MITIKKYSNRRLYDTSTSEYITLEELAGRIREGHDVEVVDASSGEDITQKVLAQIILESRGAARMLPVPLLMRLIRMGDDRLTEFFGQFMSWSLEMYLQFKDGYESMYGPFANLPGPAGDWMKAMFEGAPGMGPSDKGNQADSPSGEPGDAAASSEPSVAPDETDDPARPSTEHPPKDDATTDDQQSLDEMRQEIDELKSLVQTMADNQDDDPSDED